MATSKQSPQEELLGALKLALRATSDNPHAYVLIVKGPSGGRLIVNRKKIPPKLVADARKEVGSNVVVKGVCYGDGSAMVFESPADPEELWSKVAKSLAKQAGLNLNVAFRKGRDDGEGDESGETDGEDAPPEPVRTEAPAKPQADKPPTPPASPPTVVPKTEGAKPPDVLAQCAQRLSSLLPAIKASNDPALVQAAKLVGAHLQKKDAALALKALDALAAALDRKGPPSASAVSPPGAASPWKKARQDWVEANDSLNEQLDALRVAILGHAKTEPELATVLADIADKGLNALTGDHRVRLMGAVQVIGEGAPAAIKAHGPKALAAMEAFKAHLDGNEKVDACEGNPWDVPVTIRDTLYPALGQLEQAIKAGLGQ